MQGKRTDAIAINMTKPPLPIVPEGFDFEFQDRTMGLRRAGSAQFRAPYVIQYNAEFEKPPTADDDTPPRVFNLTAVMIPTKPGWSRIMLFGGQARKENQQREKEARVRAAGSKGAAKSKRRSKPKFNLMRFLFGVLPTWMIHQLSNRFLDSDLAFLHYQEQERERRYLSFRRRHKKDGGTAVPYFMPAQADRCISALRQWIQMYGPNNFVARDGQDVAVLPPAMKDKSILFDRFAQHTDQCQHCSKALEDIAKWRKNTYRILGLSVFLVHKFLLARISAVACLVLLRLLSSIEPSLKVGGFDHYKNH